MKKKLSILKLDTKEENLKEIFLRSMDNIVKNISNNISNIGEGVQHESNFLNNTLFLKGEYSNYINDNDKIEITKYFPKASIITIPNSNHWLHVDNPDNFFDTILDFIKDKY